MTSPGAPASPSSDAASSLVLPVSATLRTRNIAKASSDLAAYLGDAMAIEQTLILCKADAVARGLIGEIVARYERRGYAIAAMKLMVVDEALAKKHYAEHTGKPFFNGLVEFLTCAPIVALVVEGADAIEGCRTTNGATNPI